MLYMTKSISLDQYLPTRCDMTFFISLWPCKFSDSISLTSKYYMVQPWPILYILLTI